jgi:hypothetical protein
MQHDATVTEVFFFSLTTVHQFVRCRFGSVQKRTCRGGAVMQTLDELGKTHPTRCVSRGTSAICSYHRYTISGNEYYIIIT